MASFSRIVTTEIAVAVATTDTVATIYPDICEGYMDVLIHNSGSAALDAFTVEVQVDPNGPWVTLDAATPSSPVEFVTTALATLAAGAKSIMQLNVNGIYAIRLKASADTNATTLAIYTNQGGSLS